MRIGCKLGAGIVLVAAQHEMFTLPFMENRFEIGTFVTPVFNAVSSLPQWLT
jgi:hypothetical protein